jgi:hypothetical protein
VTAPDHFDAGTPAAAEARRLTGPNLFAAAPGATLDAVWRGTPLPDEATLATLATRWHDAFGALAAGAGWPAPARAERVSGDGATRVLQLFGSAPIDQLDAAVDAAERAWGAALADRRSVPTTTPRCVRPPLRRAARRSRRCSRPHTRGG